MKKIIISGVNLVDGGTLTVLKDCIKEFSQRNEFIITCLVHSAELFADIKSDKISFLEFKEIKQSWLARMKFEYITCKKISKKLSPDIWLSMHDITPNVCVENLFVYCHNPAPFYPPTYMDFKFNKKAFLFTLLYKYLYKINITKNKAVIVQQSWISDFFYKELKAKKVLIAKPVESVNTTDLVDFDCKGSLRLFYPALGRTFKNFEILLNALQFLKDNNNDVYKSIKLILTIDKNSGEFSRYIIDKYSGLSNVEFVGLLNKHQVDEEYKKCDIVMFPSKLETWGLPISEAKQHNKPIILSDLPYAYETLGNYHSACFIDSNDYVQLASTLENIISNQNVFRETIFEEAPNVRRSWGELVNEIIQISSKSLKESK
jgi:glycosyltransferase involved in cell wall biosynthesis